MHSTVIIASLFASTSVAMAAPTPKEQLLKPPADATHYVVVSTAGKHGDEYRWTLPDGRLAFRQSILLRGLVYETDETIRFGADGMPIELVVRGVTPNGNADEHFRITAGAASWVSPVDKGRAHYSTPAYYVTQGGTFLATSAQVERLLAAKDKSMDLLPSGKASLQKLTQLDINGPRGKKRIELQLLRGTSQTPSLVWTEGDKFFGVMSGLTLLPEGYEQNSSAMQKAQDEAIAALAPAIAKRFLTEAAKRPVLFNNVQVFDADREQFANNQNVLVDHGKIVSVGSLPGTLPPGTRRIDGRGKTLIPGLWDSHLHMGDDYNAVIELALGVTSCRNPGGSIELAVSQQERRKAGTLLAPECFTSAIIDQKGPLVARRSIAVSSLEETLAGVRRVKAAGLTGVKFYTSMKPEWIAPAAKLAHQLGLHVHGHIPAGMRTLDAIDAGYDEITHIYFATMQAMPEEVVAKANTTMRMLGPGKYFKDVDLAGTEITNAIDTMARHHTVLDPTLVIVENVMLAEAGTVSPSYAPYVGTVPPATEREVFKAGGLPLLEGMSLADARASFKKMGEYVVKLRRAGVPIVAGTDGWGMELVRELEIYVEAGMTPAEALATATIVPARNVGIDNRTGSIAIGKEADLVLVDGDPSKNISDLRHVEWVMSDGVLMNADELRKEAGFNGRPK